MLEAQGRALDREVVQRALAVAVGHGERAVPELGVGMDADQRARQRVLQRVEDDERARAARQRQPARLDRGESVGEPLPEPRIALL